MKQLDREKMEGNKDMMVMNITTMTQKELASSIDEIINEFIRCVPPLQDRKQIEDVYFVENTINDAQSNLKLMQEIVNRLHNAGFEKIKAHALTNINNLPYHAKFHVEFTPMLAKGPLLIKHPEYVSLFILDSETSAEYQEALSLYKEEAERFEKNTGFKTKSMEFLAIEEYIAAIKSSALKIITKKSFIELFNSAENTFVANETADQRNIRIKNESHSNRYDIFETERQVATGLIAKRIDQLEMHIKLMRGYHINNDSRMINKSNLISKLKSLFLTNLLPQNLRGNKKLPQKMLADLRLLNAIIDQVDARLWRQIIIENLSLYEHADDLPEVFNTTYALLKNLHQGKFNNADIILEDCEKITSAVAAAMPIARAHALMQNDDLIEFEGRI